ncbi:MAG: ABC transporter permease [Candidatus Thermoplasmatota archaeon]|nr:ABC transporter permease [Candidatus Thermoplasmatota archaeon]MCL5888945.1 ABC transporter permease [Candidatus Thermoplasmatota archaeon]
MIEKRYLIRRFINTLIIAYGAITLNFLLPRIIPGNPVMANMFGGGGGQIGNPVVVARLTREFGLNNPNLFYQYGRYLVELAHGNLGISFYYYPENVSSVIMQRLPWTLFLVGTATLIAAGLGIILGIYLAWRRGTARDSLISSAGMLVSSIPYFWIGMIFLIFFAVDITIFPVGHAVTPGVTYHNIFSYMGDVLYHGFLPIATLVVALLPTYALQMRNTMVTVMQQDYIKTAVAKGLPDYVVKNRYAARNAVLPVTTHVGLSLGYVVGGALMIEYLFAYPGVGYTLFSAIQNEDYPLMQGIFLIISLMVILANFMVDVLYTYLDPRVSLR